MTDYDWQVMMGYRGYDFWYYWAMTDYDWWQ